MTLLYPKCTRPELLNFAFYLRLYALAAQP